MINVINTEESATRTETFTAITAGGRKMRIEVEAAKDIADMTILEDLRQSLHPGAGATVAKEEISRWEELILILFVWISACALAGVTVVVLDFAEFVDINGSLIFAKEWPIIGGFTLYKGLFRLFLVLLPIIITLWAVRSLVIKAANNKG